LRTEEVDVLHATGDLFDANARTYVDLTRYAWSSALWLDTVVGT